MYKLLSLLLLTLIIPNTHSCENKNLNRSTASFRGLRACRQILHNIFGQHPRFSLSINEFEKNIHPGQYQVGMLSVKNKVNQLVEMESNELQAFLDDKIIPYIAAPDGKYWIIDRHHTSLSVIAAREIWNNQGINTQDIKVTFSMVKDWSYMTQKKFLKKMKKKKYIYSRKNGKKKKPKHLPQSLDLLTDDPYRSLAWVVKLGGAFKKVQTPFLEFIWGDFLRDRMVIKNVPITEKDLSKAYHIILNQVKNTQSLPGHIKRIFQNPQAKELYIQAMIDSTVHLLQ